MKILKVVKNGEKLVFEIESSKEEFDKYDLKVGDEIDGLDDGELILERLGALVEEEGEEVIEDDDD